jgi:nitric oxide reductase activation protein
MALETYSSIKSKAESVVKKILDLDSDDLSSDTDTVDSSSSSDSDDSIVVSKKSKKHKSKNQKKSGIFDHPSFYLPDNISIHFFQPCPFT